jgi:hypothetical protein
MCRVGSVDDQNFAIHGGGLHAEPASVLVDGHDTNVNGSALAECAVCASLAALGVVTALLGGLYSRIPGTALRRYFPIRILA